jgi:Tfp pilus assembly protein PilO
MNLTRREKFFLNILFVFLILIALVVGFYLYLNERSEIRAAITQSTEFLSRLRQEVQLQDVSSNIEEISLRIGELETSILPAEERNGAVLGKLVNDLAIASGLKFERQSLDSQNEKVEVLSRYTGTTTSAVRYLEALGAYEPNLRTSAVTMQIRKDGQVNLSVRVEYENLPD